MGWFILYDKDEEQGAFACNTSGVVFGPLMDGEREDMQDFGESLEKDPRLYDINELMSKWYDYREKL